MVKDIVPAFVRVIITDDSQRVLVVKHRKPSYSIINFPGGKVEHNETPLAAVQRELYEETGITLTSTELITRKYFNIDGTQWIGYFYMGQTQTTQAINMEPHKHSFVGFCKVSVAKRIGHKDFVTDPLKLIAKQCGL